MEWNIMVLLQLRRLFLLVQIERTAMEMTSPRKGR